MTTPFAPDNPLDADSPALLVYPELIAENIRLAKTMLKDISLFRPHVKTHKIKEVAEMMINANIKKFKCATIAEAEMLALAGAPDVLLAYQPTQTKAKRLAALYETYPLTRFSCIADNRQTVAELSIAFAGKSLEVYIDVNAGMNRTGIKPDAVFRLYDECRTLNNIVIAGLHVYDGHIHDADAELRKQKALEIYNCVYAIKQTIEKDASRHLKLVMGGTPTFSFYAQLDDVETSPGTFIFWDEGYRQLMPELDFSIAAVLLTRVISIIDNNTLCLDLGHKSVAAENPLPRVKFIDMPDATPIAQSEEHLVVKVSDTAVHRVGDVWYAVPYHICPTVALYDTVYVVEEKRIAGKWKVIARDRSIYL